MAIYNQSEITKLNNSNNALIIMFPFAGGNMYSYKDIIKSINPKFDIYCPELPGRGDLYDIPLISDINNLAQYIFISSIKNLRLNKKYLLYGHSMGALLVYLISKSLAQENYNLPIRLIVSGREGPSSKREKTTYDLPQTEFYNKLKLLGGVSPEVLMDKELMEYFDPIFRSDFQAVETYIYNTSHKFLNIPITSLYGTEEGLTFENIHKWGIETTNKTNYISMTGDHFFIFKNPQNIARIIENSLNKGND